MRYASFIAGEASLHVCFGGEIDPLVNRRVHAAAAGLRSLRLSGIRDVVPGYASLYVELDATSTTAWDIQRVIDDLPEHAIDETAPGPVVEIPVCYGGTFGPDLETLAGETGLTEQEVIDIHRGRDYDVFFMGFTPGFAFLGIVDDRIAKPRLAVPRPTVPAGSVGIAGNQTGIYPVVSPGGWRLIGLTPRRMADLSGAEPRLLLQPGARVRFVAISEREFATLQ